MVTTLAAAPVSAGAAIPATALWFAMFTVAALCAWMDLAHRCDPYHRRRLHLPPAPTRLVAAEVLAAACCFVGFAATAVYAAM